MLRERTSALLNCIDSALRSNRDALEGLAGSVNSGDRIERDANLPLELELEPQQWRLQQQAPPPLEL
jgi:NCK-associated protein 1